MLQPTTQPVIPGSLTIEAFDPANTTWRRWLHAGKKLQRKNTGDKQPGQVRKRPFGQCMYFKSQRVVCFQNTSSTNNLEEMLSLEHADYRDKFLVSLDVEGKSIKFELDSGAAVTVISESEATKLFPTATICHTELRLISFCGRALKCRGYITVSVRHNSDVKRLNIYLVGGVRKPLLGREWIRQLNCYDLLVCDAEFAAIKDIQIHLKLKKDASPVFVRARPVLFKLQMLVEKELDTLEKAGVIEKVESSKWATPIVSILKKDGSIRICGDYKATLNPHLIVYEYPFPTVDELFLKLRNGKKFSKIDLKQPYLQLEVAPEDRELLTISTFKGLYKVVQIKNLTRLEEVLSRLHKFNIRINLEKSKFFLDKVDYCGYEIDRIDIHKEKKKIEAIHKMPRPKNISEVRAFTGMINYYGRFIQNLSSILRPLNKLLQKEGVPFIWSNECETAFNKAKVAFTSNQVLVHFDPNLPLVLATDVSSYGVGAVLSHRYPDGSEKVIQFASQTFSKVQAKYSQIDKEAFAIVFGVKRFVQFLYGTKFTLITDHRPLVQIFSPYQSLPIYSAMRMQHYAIFLQEFNYEIEYRKSEKHANADCLSRLPVDAPQMIADVVDAYQVEVIETLPVTANRIAAETRKDKDVSDLLQALQTGKQIHKSKRFGIEQNEFSLQNNVIMRPCAYIPKILRFEVLKELHSGHFGVVKMKSLARSHCWWPTIDKDLEQLARNCVNCNEHRNNPPKVEVHVWEAPSAPMQRIHIDFAGPFLGKMFLLMIDAFSKWPEVHIVKDITAKTTIMKLREIFAAYGLPQVVVTDNGKDTPISCTENDHYYWGFQESPEPIIQNNSKSKNLEQTLAVPQGSAPEFPQTDEHVAEAKPFVETLRRSARTRKCPDFFSECAVK
ncbi:PREDICTED: uncharacterized protein K02A2.6-like [Cyphomyrmex costatus]|uniref:uncharacterized protein K02A2.6-like n=1 Tax=Cyphomyrmex costatus TaxID=456900 RepID=UPI0008523E95|nr:PREDICTED: uncharacterized protein K02A2.6-like [Cyphomyrmex costatus]